MSFFRKTNEILPYPHLFTTSFHYSLHFSVTFFTFIDASDKDAQAFYDELTSAYEGVKENMEEVIDDQESVKSQEQIVEVDFRIKNYNDEEAYTEYILSDLPITKYAECKSYKDLLSKDCRVKVPYITCLLYTSDAADE